MQNNNRNKIKQANEAQLKERLKKLTSAQENVDNPINDIIGVSNNEEYAVVDPNGMINNKATVLANDAIFLNPGIEHANNSLENKEEKSDLGKQNDVEPIPQDSLSSLQNRFGVKKINRPVKDSQLTARIDSKTLKRFKEIVKTMYYPDKPNINETVTQIIRAFVAEYDKNNIDKQNN